jgi:uncharacterized membrane protein
MNKINLYVILFLVFFLPSIYSYTISDISTDIVVRSNGSLEVGEEFKVGDFKDTNELIFTIFPVYDMIVKINNDSDLNYSYGIDKLIINTSSYSTNEIILNITYLTDYYTTKDSNGWNINYNPLFLDKTGEFKITFPINSDILALSTDIKNLHPDKDQFYVIDSNLTNFKASYKLSNQKIVSETKNNSLLFVIILIIVVGLILAYLFIHKNKIKQNKTKLNNEDKKEYNLDNNQNEKLLLGLNENEQKIIKLLLQDDGLSQQKIALKLFLPKGTVSRNIKKLEDKGYIDIKKYGVTNKAFLSSLFNQKK